MAEVEKGVKIREEFYTKLIAPIKHIKAYQELIDKNQDTTTTKLVNIILGGAAELNSSDIHLEPREKTVRVRVRVDGVLHTVTSIPLPIYDHLLSRIKLLSNLKLNITKQAQDGRFNISLEQKEIEIRTSILPTQYGESMVMRILDPENLIEIKELGLRKDLLQTFKREIMKPHGMIIVTGPTGSGKTTTLYAFLKTINKPEIKIITIENPIEYQLEGITQTQVEPDRGYTFSTGLESIVRQDPDVILVGEIRNLETTKIALQAAMTGHLVFSTLHTNNAAGTIARLKALGAAPENIAPAINMTIAQRLVRKVCPKCTTYEKPNEKERKELQEGLKKAPEKLKKQLQEKDFKIARTNPKGCEYCNFTGYKGRIGIFESLLINDHMEKVILQSPSVARIKEEAAKQGMLTMYQDGLVKVIQQDTTLEEVHRVTEND